MPSKIDGLNPGPTRAVTELTGTPRRDSADRRGVTASGGSDTVSLTGDADKLHALTQQLADQPVADSRRVDSIRAALANGSYQVDPQAVAAKLAHFEQALAKR